MSLKTKIKRFLVCGLAFSGILMCGSTEKICAMDCDEYALNSNITEDKENSCFTRNGVYFDSLVGNTDTPSVFHDEELSSQVLPPEGLCDNELKQFYVNEFLVKKSKDKNLTVKKFSHDNGLSWNTFKGWIYKYKKEDIYFPQKTKKLKSKDKIKKAFVEKYILEKSRDKSMSVRRYAQENNLAWQTLYSWLNSYKKETNVDIFQRKVWTKEEKQRYVEEYLKANSEGETISVQNYVEKNNLPMKAFYRWLHKWKKKANVETPQHKMWTEEEKLMYIMEYLKANSGGRIMSISDFAKAYNLKYSTVYTWVKNYVDKSYIIF